MKTLGERIKQRRLLLRLTQDDLGAIFTPKLQRSAISKWERDASVPDITRLPALAKKLKTTVNYLVSGQDPEQAKKYNLNQNDFKILDFNKIPLLQFSNLASWQEKINQEADEHIFSTDKSLSLSAFAVVIEGDNMSPEFKAGDKIIVDPREAPRPGDSVIALKDESQTVFQCYRSKGVNENGFNIFELFPLNANYPTFNSAYENLKIIGTVVEHIRKLR